MKKKNILISVPLLSLIGSYLSARMTVHFRLNSTDIFLNAESIFFGTLSMLLLIIGGVFIVFYIISFIVEDL